MSSPWTTRTRRMGRSPEIPWAHSPGWPSTLRSRTSGPARSEASVYRTREARRSKRWASSLEMPRCRNVLCAWVKASAKVRAEALGSWYLCAMARAPSRLSAIPVAKDRRTNPPGAKRMRCRRLTIGSSTAPVVPERARPSRATGSSGLRPRPRNRPRSVSHSTGPCILPSTLNTWTAHTRASSRARGRRAQTRAALSGKYSASTKSLLKARELAEWPPRVGALAPAVPGVVASAAEAAPASRVGDDGGVGAVGQELGMRVPRVRRREAPDRPRGDRSRHPRLLGGPGLRDGSVARRALLQQERGGLHPGIGVEAPYHRMAQDGGGQSHQAHCLVVRQGGPGDEPLGALGAGAAH